MTSNVFPRETSRGTPCLCVAFAGLLHRTTPSRRNAAGIGPVVPNLHQTGSSAVNPTPYTLTTVPPPTGMSTRPTAGESCSSGSTPPPSSVSTTVSASKQLSEFRDFRTRENSLLCRGPSQPRHEVTASLTISRRLVFGALPLLMLCNF